MISNKLIKILEKEFKVTVENDTVSLNTHTDSGEEFYEEFNAKNNEELYNELYDRNFNYDADEHFALWYGQNKGEPSSPSALLEACHQYGNLIDTAFTMVRDYVFPL